VKRSLVQIILILSLTTSCGYTFRNITLIPSNNWSNIKCVAIIPFQNLTEHPSAGNIMADIIATELYITQRFGVIERTEVQRFAKDMGITLGNEIDSSLARRIGELMSVEGVIIGTVTEFWYRNARQKFSEEEPVVGATFRLIDVKNGDVLWTSGYTRTSYDIFLTQRDPLTRIAQIVAKKAIYPIHEAPPPNGKIALVCSDGWKKLVQNKLAMAKSADTRTAQIKSAPGLKDPRLIALSKKFVKGKSIITREIKFAGNTSTLDPSSYAFLDDFGKILQSRPDLKIRIDGHVDPFGTPDECKVLTQNWADTIRDFLVSRFNIPSPQINSQGFGSDIPLMPNITKRGRDTNRRVEITILDSK